MSVWQDKLNTPRYRVEPIIDTKDHMMIELVNGWDLSCFKEAEDTRYTGRKWNYCPLCGDKLERGRDW